MGFSPEKRTPQIEKREGAMTETKQPALGTLAGGGEGCRSAALTGGTIEHCGTSRRNGEEGKGQPETKQK